MSETRFNEKQETIDFGYMTYLADQAFILGTEFIQDSIVLDKYLDRLRLLESTKWLPSEYAYPQIIQIYTENGLIDHVAPPDGRFHFLHDAYSGHLKIMHKQLSPITKAIVGDPFFNMFRFPEVMDLAFLETDCDCPKASEALSKAFYKQTRLNSNNVTYMSRAGFFLAFAAIPPIIIQIDQSPDPVAETLRQGTVLGGAYIGASMAGEAAFVPSLATGPFAPWCVLGASLLGGIAGAMSADCLCSVVEKLEIPDDKSDLFNSLKAAVTEPGFPVNMPTENHEQEKSEAEPEPVYEIQISQEPDIIDTDSPADIVIQSIHTDDNKMKIDKKIITNERQIEKDLLKAELEAIQKKILQGQNQLKTTLQLQKKEQQEHQTEKLRSRSDDTCLMSASRGENLFSSSNLKMPTINNANSMFRSYRQPSGMQQYSASFGEIKTSSLKSSSSDSSKFSSSAYTQNQKLFLPSNEIKNCKPLEFTVHCRK